MFTITKTPTNTRTPTKTPTNTVTPTKMVMCGTYLYSTTKSNTTTTLNVSLGITLGSFTVSIKASDLITRATYKIFYNGVRVYDSITPTGDPITVSLNRVAGDSGYVTITGQSDSTDSNWEVTVTCPIIISF